MTKDKVSERKITKACTIDKDHWLMLCYPFSPIPTDPELPYRL
jgi:hypothetical protein